MNTKHWMTAGLTALMLPALALAHPGHGATEGFAAGALHPLAGVDHLATLFAIGLWAAQLGGRMRLAVPAAFMLLMLAGAAAGLHGPVVDLAGQTMAASLLVLGVLMASAARLAAKDCLLLAALFAFFHGYAHGAEAPAQAGVAAYLAGMLLTTAAMHAAGVAVGAWLERRGGSALTRWTGGATALLGIALLAS